MIYIYVFIYHKPYIMHMSYHDATGRLVITGRAYHLSGEASLAFFLKSKKMCPDFRKKRPNCVHPYAKFTIQHVVLRISKIKNFKIFPCGAIFSGIFDNTFIGVP